MYEPPQQQPPMVPQPPNGWGYQAEPQVVAPAGEEKPAPRLGYPIRRGLAWAVDFALMLLLAVGLGFVTYRRLVSPVSGVGREAASGVRKLFTSGFDVAGVAAKTGTAVWGEITALIVQGFIALVVIQFLYQFIAMAWTGRTLGKALFDLRVVPAGTGAEKAKPGKGRAARRAAVTAFTDTGLFSIACCLLVSGWFVLSVLCWLLAVAAFWSNALPSLTRRRSSLADLAAGTTVAEAGLYRSVATSVAKGGQAAATRIATEARGLAEHERLRQAWESQRAQQLRQGAAEKGRQAWESQPAQQLRQAGQGAAAKGKQAWESERAQQLRQGAADKGKQAWNKLRKGGQTPAVGQQGNPITAGNFAQPPAVAPPPMPPGTVVPPAMPPPGTNAPPPQPLPPVGPGAAIPPPAQPAAPFGPGPVPPPMPPAPAVYPPPGAPGYPPTAPVPGQPLPPVGYPVAPPQPGQPLPPGQPPMAYPPAPPGPVAGGPSPYAMQEYDAEPAPDPNPPRDGRQGEPG